MTGIKGHSANDRVGPKGSIASRTRKYLARIDRDNPEIHAFTSVDRDRALETARNLDSLPESHRGALYGMVVAVKDNIDTKDCCCSAGIQACQDRIASEDASIVAHLRAEHGVILGVTATDSGAFGVTTPAVVNPVRPDRIAGGSSGGSAAAVKAGLCDIAIGTDTGGSVRIPAACCEIFGFKPTSGIISTKGVRPMSPRFDHIGFLAGSIPPFQRILGLFNAAPSSLITSRHVTVGVSSAFLKGIESEVSEAVDRLKSFLREKNHTIIEVELPDIEEVLDFHLTLSLADAAAEYDRREDLQCEYLPEVMLEGLSLGRKISKRVISKAEAARSAWEAKIEAHFSEIEFLLVPTMPCHPPRRKDSTVLLNGKAKPILSSLIRFTAPFNQTGHPALSFPDPTCAGDRPVSLQLIGRRNHDADLLGYANELFTQVEVETNRKDLNSKPEVE
ncbi:amidase [Thalassospira lucentensis]|uniref:amidase n=1 Tax=Thalassospira lucentensis TaxID=168935 RepID=UPI003AA90428